MSMRPTSSCAVCAGPSPSSSSLSISSAAGNPASIAGFFGAKRCRKGISLTISGLGFPKIVSPIVQKIRPLSRNRLGHVAVIGPNLRPPSPSLSEMKFRIEQTPPFLLQMVSPPGANSGTSPKNRQGCAAIRYDCAARSANAWRAVHRLGRRSHPVWLSRLSESLRGRASGWDRRETLPPSELR